MQSRRRAAVKLVAWGVGIAALWPALLMWEVSRYSEVRDRREADAAVVLGAAAWHRRPSPVFAERINHALDLYRAGRVKRLLFTGGHGRGAPHAESEVARRYALARGVPAAHIHLETRSRTTLGNLKQASRIIRAQRWRRVLIVSDPLHMRRALLMARHLGLDAHPSPTPTSRFRSRRSRATFLLRETWFLAGYRLSRVLD